LFLKNRLKKGIRLSEFLNYEYHGTHHMSPESDMTHSSKLKIAFVIKNFVSTGGAERYAVEIAQRLVGRGHSIDLYARDIDRDLTQGMQVFQVPDKMKFSSAFSLHSFTKESSKLLRGKSYDIIHSHDKGCIGDVSTVHTFSFKRGMDRMSLIKKINEFVISPRAWLYLYMEGIQARTQCLAAVSQTIKADIQACHNRHSDIEVIPPGVDIHRFSPETIGPMREKARADAGLEPDDLAVLFIGSEFRRKGLDLIIPALGKGMQLFVVGRQERMPHYNRLVEKHRVQDAVRFTGLTDNVTAYYALADVVVLPSLAEAFGMTVLEGMACGLPVITSRQAGCSFLISSGQDGLVFESPDQISDMLEKLRDGSVRKEMGACARETALASTWDHAADQYEKLYTEISAKNPVK